MGNDSTNMMLFTLKLLKGDFVWELFYGDCILILSMLMRGVLVAESIVVNKRLYSLFGFLLTSIRIMIFSLHKSHHNLVRNRLMFFSHLLVE